MAALVAQPLPALPDTLADDRQAAHRFALAEKAEATRRAYRTDFRAFQTYCEGRDLASMPASPETIAAYLAALAGKGLRPATIDRAIAAIRYAHRLAGVDSPTSAEAVRATMRGIRRTVGAAKVQKAAATSAYLLAMLAACPETLRGKRDRALLCLGFAGAFRRSELVALNVEDLAVKPSGLEVIIRSSKTDQAGEGQVIAIPYGARIRPVEAVQVWLAAAAITNGPIFRAINKAGCVAEKGMTAESAAAVVKRYAEACGYDPAQFGGHSLRAGFLTSAAEAGASIFKMVEVSRHRSIETLRGYVRRADLFKDHAGTDFL
jgi:site-specific recombinase XerD